MTAEVAPVTLTCPECEGAVELPQAPRLSEITSCPECASELEVTGLDPITLAAAPDIEEDWGE
jgi:alpha-aminoadipate/glutamate carrier protein LysW